MRPIKVKAFLHDILYPLLLENKIDMKEVKISYELENSLGDTVCSDDTYDLLADVISELDCKLADNTMTIVDEVVSVFLQYKQSQKEISFETLFDEVSRHLCDM